MVKTKTGIRARKIFNLVVEESFYEKNPKLCEFAPKSRREKQNFTKNGRKNGVKKRDFGQKCKLEFLQGKYVVL